jgi:hypothetical protein
MAMVGALLIHLAFLFVHLPSHRVAPTSYGRVGDVLEVRLIARARTSIPIASSTPFDRPGKPSQGKTLEAGASRDRARFGKQVPVAGTPFVPSDAQGGIGNEGPVTGAIVTTQSGRELADKNSGDGAGHGYIQVRPSGNSDVMTRAPGRIVYQATRFESDWTPGHESSMDTVVRRVIDDNTITRTFALPRGVHVDCGASLGGLNPFSEALMLASVRCHGDPLSSPSTAAAEAIGRNQTLAPTKPLARIPPSTTIPTATAAPAAPDNKVLCVTSRVSGAPVPPGCDFHDSPSPANGSSSVAVPSGY